MTRFLLDLQQIKMMAKQSMDQGALTSANYANQEEILYLLESALSTELICVLRYLQHSVTAAGIHAEAVSAHFAKHSEEELGHAKMLAKRIHQLGGEPSFDPEVFPGRSHADYRECDTLREMLEENLLAERIAVISYTEMIRFIGENDPTTRRILESILEVEEEHADELASLLDAKHDL